MIFKKRTDGYYAKQRKSLREEIRKMERETQWPNKRKAKRLNKLRRRYEKVSQKWWDLRRSVQFEGAEFGLDTTGYGLTLEDKTKLSSLPGDYENLHPSDKKQRHNALRVLKDKSTKVEYKRDSEGLMRKYENGKRTEDYPVSANVMGTTLEEEE